MKFEAYKRYKEDTDYITAWLATNAHKCGYKVLSVSQDNGPTNTEGTWNGGSSDKGKKDVENLKERAAAIAPKALGS
ncbi:hypothetical protein PtrSN002B_009372 [Pyrenophora tritici-repentis]|uniref:DUF6604 domain-containing protein n=1 Tax=Pyrenophora tritici-repentis TaxID=45151 RepID=A0A2W1E756_9PLEO|nr:hypothetical protein PtrV1_13676 [Pyrenophora tritici-repentis]KAF7447295.1 hypothetical protein A1F99_087420 [Pyrenophora tritici-repentis]KAF7569658.1 hypothetical protein PtrM4_120730 [Pyrenophora tritici-repentis]KAG9382612.1 hypothetical protein A1F94_006533 [Pyrenophora tritici-repentis]KAI1510233.1 hypothetical protein Ptr86124_010679 [Pyrenophora tritici-repentis]